MTAVPERRRPSPVYQAAKAAAATLRGQLPPRYEGAPDHWEREFWALAEPGLNPGARILDVGAGRTPTLPRHRRPEAATYVGLDRSRSELEASAPASYDEIVVSDICEHLPALEDGFDLILSWQVLEHVASLDRATDNLHSYLRDGGYVVALLSGRYSLFGLANLLLPQRLSQPLVARLMRRDPETVFPAHYDQCHYSALERLLGSWSSARVISAWNGAPYFAFFRPLKAGYIFYEEWAWASGHNDLATHYFLQLRK